MEVTIQSSSVITVSSSRVKFSRVPLSLFDRFAFNFHVSTIFAFVGPTAPNAALKAGLEEVLVHFPTLAGTLGEDDRGRLCINVGDGGAGALVVEATVAADLADYLPLKPFRDMTRLHPPVDPVPTHLVQIQLNRFRCGGLVVGLTSHHRVADGQSMGFFFVAWGRAVRGLDPDPIPIIHDRPWLRARDPPRCEFDHGFNDLVSDEKPPSPEDIIQPGDITNISVHYSRDFIDTYLKSSSAAGAPWTYTTFETLLGHVWRKLTIARGLPREVFSRVTIAVNGRQRLRPAVPPEFFGNMVLSAYARAKAGDLIDGGLEAAAKIIHDAVARTDEKFFLSFIDFGEVHGDEKEAVPSYDPEGMPMALCPNLEVDSWAGFRFQEIDFGGAGEGGGGATPCAFLPSWLPAEGIIILNTAPPPAPGLKSAGIDVLITLFGKHEKLFRQISHTLD